MVTKPPKKKQKYSNLQDGEPIYVSPYGAKIACCDCGLIHELQFRIELVAFRDQRATGQLRRHRKIKIVNNL
jgi:hypothetical protein